MEVNTKSLRSLANKFNHPIIMGALNESADYIDEQKEEIEQLKANLEISNDGWSDEIERRRNTEKDINMLLNKLNKYLQIENIMRSKNRVRYST